MKEAWILSGPTALWLLRCLITESISLADIGSSKPEVTHGDDKLWGMASETTGSLFRRLSKCSFQTLKVLDLSVMIFPVASRQVFLFL